MIKNVCAKLLLSAYTNKFFALKFGNFFEKLRVAKHKNPKMALFHHFSAPKICKYHFFVVPLRPKTTSMRMEKMLLPLLVFLASCGTSTIEQGIKGHTFARENKVSLTRLSFKRDMSVEYKWKNGWEKKPNTRDDLSYIITSDTSFQVFTDTMSVWGNGVYYSQRRPYILLDNFKGDTLYLKY